jgi:hypothetical protein
LQGVTTDKVIISGTLSIGSDVSRTTGSDIRIFALGSSTACTKLVFNEPGEARDGLPGYRCEVDVPPDTVTEIFPNAALFAGIFSGLRVVDYSTEFQQGQSLAFEDNKVCAAGVNFFQRVSGEGANGEETFIKFDLENYTYVAFDNDPLTNDNEFTLNLVVKGQQDTNPVGPCVQAPGGVIIVL